MPRVLTFDLGKFELLFLLFLYSFLLNFSLFLDLGNLAIKLLDSGKSKISSHFFHLLFLFFLDAGIARLFDLVIGLSLDSLDVFLQI